MEVQIKINGTFLDGVANTDVKLSLTTNSPYQFGETARSYSASIKAPRSKNNDEIFAAMRYPGVFSRTKAFEAEVYVGGIKLSGNFRAKVVCDTSSYNVSLSESVFKRDQLPSQIISTTQLLIGSGPYYSLTDIFSLLRSCMNLSSSPSFPEISPDYKTYYPAIRMPVPESDTVSLQGRLVDKGVSFFWKWAADTEDGTKYFGGAYIDIAEYDVRNVMYNMTYQSSLTATVQLDNTGFVILDMSRVGTALNFVVLKDKATNGTVATFRKVSQNGLSEVRYELSSSTITLPFGNSGSNFDGYYLSRDINVFEPINASPPDYLSTDQAFKLTGRITAVNQPSAFVIFSFALPGYSNGVELLNDLCKAMLWKWSFTMIDQPDGTQKPYLYINNIISTVALNTDGIVSFNARRQDWSRFFVSFEQSEDSEGLAVNNIVKVGDYENIIRVSEAPFTRKSEIISSNLPLSGEQDSVRAMIWANTPSSVTDFFRSDSYIKKLTDYYAHFSDAIDVTIKAKIPYLYYVSNFFEDGLVWFDQLGAFFYIRSITDYSVRTGDCKMKLTKVNVNR